MFYNICRFATVIGIMEESHMQKNVNAEYMRWDLTFLYAGVDDPALSGDVVKWAKMAEDFGVHYKGKLGERLGEAITDYASLEMLKGKIFMYLYLRQSTDVADASVKAKIAEVERLISAADGEFMTFFLLELVALEDRVLDWWYARDSEVARHRPWVEHERVFKPHILTEPVESALTKRSPFWLGAWSEFFDEFEADLRFAYKNEGKSLTEMLHVLTSSPDAEERAEVLRIINAGLAGPFAKYAAQTLYIVAGSQSVERKERGFKHPMEGRNKSNRIPDTVVDALHKAVAEASGPLARRYYTLKAWHLGLKKLKWSDRNAPMPFVGAAAVPFEEALALVLGAYESFSPTLTGIIRDFVSKRRIDVPAIKGKRGGAFNYSAVLPGKEALSFTFLNYLGSPRDVMTLAHELGHGVHGILAGEAQGVLMAHAPAAYCETASIFGEMTAFNFLKKRNLAANNKEAVLALVMEKIDEVLNTTVRQIGFSNFERRLHGMDALYEKWEGPQKYSVEELDAIWLATLQELYGREGDVFTYDDTQHLWAYVSHFHRPFYVYGYAFGELLTQRLYAERERLGEQFEPLYLDLLRSGGTKDVIELVKPFGLDPAHEEFWVDAITNNLGALIEEAEQLSSELR